ncbi:MAG: glutamine--fructose-6-phosphate transaminase (isomerizing) [Firmicutes bacterium]|nr:glutamine--fructose-6-phosphate transaminase (isomerizing) [Bacillota bacterium]MDY5531726.1 glutamine--fructose-6-phosphate transaminase (isomerizing) [Pumilibacteraceae bacterium]
MCGIVGFTGRRQAAPVLFAGLKKLEYRGYDSSGVATIDEGTVHLVKTKGRVSDLVEKSKDGALLPGFFGIGHTRWATHGAPSDVNAHPMMSNGGNFALVHNGIIENYAVIKDELTASGYTFKSETDTEVLVNLIEREYESCRDVLTALSKAISEARGSFALGLITPLCPGEIFAVRRHAPLIVGAGTDFNMIASDIPALLGKTDKVVIPDEDCIVRLSADKIALYDGNLEPVEPKYNYFETSENDSDKDGFPHFMLKEIYQQPEAVGKILLDTDRTARMSAFLKEKFGGFPQKIDVVGCGSAYHAGLVGKYFIESVARIPVEAYTAGEYRYKGVITGEKTLTVIISQSGETADSLAALKEAKSLRSPVLGIVNAEFSSIARESDCVFFTDAGTEIAVATTKGYCTQVAALFRLALALCVDREKIAYYSGEFARVPALMSAVINSRDKIFSVAKYVASREDAYFIGRCCDYATACEGALKLKEISYIHAEAYAAAELKHGTISLICEGVPVIALSFDPALDEKMLASVKEVRSRGGVVFGITSSSDVRWAKECSAVIDIPACDRFISALVAIPALQLLGYYAAEMRGCDIDKPRNLAKSVTVE